MIKHAIASLKAAAQNGSIPEWLANDAVLVLYFALFVGSVAGFLFKVGQWINTWRKRKMLERDLAPFYTRAEIYKATQYYVPTKYQNIAPSEDDEPGRKYIASAKDKLIPLFLNKAFDNDQDDNKYYLILADAGMGKTTFMINLYLRYKRQWRWWRRKYDIKLLPLGHPHTIEEIKSIKPEIQKNTILLLDALDEDPKAVKDYLSRVQEILGVVWRFREVVITCRTQFFPSKSEEPTETGYFKFGTEGGEFRFQKLYLSVFDEKDIFKYLSKRFNLFNPLNWSKFQVARRVASKSPNLVVRPMLLSHIDELVEEKGDGYQYGFEIYQVLISKWAERESEKIYVKLKYDSTDKFIDELLRFSRRLAVYLFRRQKENNSGFLIYKDEVIPFGGNLSLSELTESTEEILGESKWRSQSFLNRNAEGYYKFSHKSVLEYFLSLEAFENPLFTEEISFEGLEAAKGFCYELADKHILQNANSEIAFKFNIRFGYMGHDKVPFPKLLICMEDHSKVNLFFIKFIENIGHYDSVGVYSEILSRDLIYLYLAFYDGSLQNSVWSRGKSEISLRRDQILVFFRNVGAHRIRERLSISYKKNEQQKLLEAMTLNYSQIVQRAGESSYLTLDKQESFIAEEIRSANKQWQGNINGIELSESLNSKASSIDEFIRKCGYLESVFGPRFLY